MTEKRFTICIDSNNLKSLWDSERTEEEPLLWLTRSDRIGGIDDVCELLNEQHEQIEDLKDVNVRCCNEYSYFHKRMMELEKENEQLKSELGKLNILYKAKCKTEEQLIEMGKEVEKENKQLKQSEQEFREYCNYLKSILEDNEILYD